MKSLFFLIIVISTCQYLKAQLPDKDRKIVKFLTFNILHGATSRGDFNLDVIARVIIQTDPDFVALQEVDFRTNRAKKYDLASELGCKTGMVSLFGRAMTFDGGEYGEAILSRSTILTSRVVPLPYSEGHEPRSALEITTVLFGNDTIAFIGTHLDHTRNDSNRILQAQKINDVFSVNRHPSVLAGDLNDIPGSRTISILEKVWTPSSVNNPLPTFPSGKPVRKIDYIMFSPQNRWKVINAEVINDSIASDHCAFSVILELIN